jgi:hypothetical protein
MSHQAATSLEDSLSRLTRYVTPETRAVFLELRSLVKTTLPQASERVALGRNSLNFSHPDVGYFCRIRPIEGRVTLEFQFGVLLPDPDGILDGNSCAKQVRFAIVTSLRAMPRRGLRRLLRAAVSLPSDASSRSALVRSGGKLVLQQDPGRKGSDQ